MEFATSINGIREFPYPVIRAADLKAHQDSKWIRACPTSSMRSLGRRWKCGISRKMDARLPRMEIAKFHIWRPEIQYSHVWDLRTSACGNPSLKAPPVGKAANLDKIQIRDGQTTSRHSLQYFGLLIDSYCRFTSVCTQWADLGTNHPGTHHQNFSIRPQI